MPTTTTDAPSPLSAVTAPAPTAGTVTRLELDSPIGRILLLGDGEHVVLLEIEGQGGFRSSSCSASALSTAPPSTAPSDAVLETAAAQLHEYFHAGRRTFTVPVLLRGTAFQQQIWQQLLEIPWGETRTYGQLGVASGRPTAGRAVGGAVGANPVPLIVPCHRVLAVNRRITGYSAGAGVPTKMQLLDLERITHR